MKTRSGFVSNSSSSSFMIVGIYLMDDIEKALSKQGINYNDDYDIDVDLLDDIKKRGWKELDYGIYGKNGLVVVASYSGILGIGIDPRDDFKNGATYNDITKQVKKKINKEFGADVKESDMTFIFGEVNR